MQNKCLKTGTAWFWRTSVLVYLYFLVCHIREFHLLRALSWMAGGFDWLGKAYCLQLMAWNAAFCESTTPFSSGVFLFLIWLMAFAFFVSGSGYCVWTQMPHIRLEGRTTHSWKDKAWADEAALAWSSKGHDTNTTGCPRSHFGTSKPYASSLAHLCRFYSWVGYRFFCLQRFYSRYISAEPTWSNGNVGPRMLRDTRLSARIHSSRRLVRI